MQIELNYTKKLKTDQIICKNHVLLIIFSLLIHIPQKTIERDLFLYKHFQFPKIENVADNS